MTDLRQIDPKSNPYFQNPNIRRYLITAGLINRHGDILCPPSYEVSLAQPLKGRRTRENLSKAIHNYVAEEEQSRQTLIRNQIDFSVKHAHFKKNKRPRQLHQSVSRNLSNTRRSSLPINGRHSPKRAKSAHPSSHDSGNRFVRRSAKLKSSIKPCCRVIMTYFGPQTLIDYDKSWFQQKGDEIVVMQQHCGGENLTVFKGYVKPHETFAFDSQRHSDYPFALALYINGLIDSRISVCCEYKHKRNVPLGGPHGLFAIFDVQKVKPCQSCRYERHKKKSKSATSLVLEPSRYRKSTVLRFSSRNISHSPVPRQRSNSPPASPATRGRSPDSHRTPIPPGTSTSPLEEDDKKPTISSDRRTLPVQTGHTAKIRTPPVTRTPTPPPEEDDKKPTISSNVRDLSVLPADHNSGSQSSDLSSTPTPPPPPPRRSTSHASRASSSSPEADDKKPPISSAKPYPAVVPTSYTSNIQNPAASRDTDSENYASDFDETNDDDYPPTNSRFGQPRISDSHSTDKDQEDNNNQLKSSSSTLSSSDSSDDKDDHHLNEILIGKENNIDHSRKSSSTISKKSDPTEDEDNNLLSQILSGKNNVADDSRGSSSDTSRKSDPSPNDKIKQELNEKNNHNLFSSTTTSKKDIGDRRLSLSSSEDLFGTKHSSSKEKNKNNHHSSKIHHTSSSTSEDFFGIKRSNSGEKNKDTQALSKDWFETNSRNDPDNNDRLNLYSPPKTTSWRKNIISNQDD